MVPHAVDAVNDAMFDLGSDKKAGHGDLIQEEEIQLGPARSGIASGYGDELSCPNHHPDSTFHGVLSF